MLYPENNFAVRILAEQRMQQYVHEAEIDHLLSQAPRGRSWWSRQALPSLGAALASLGERLMTLDRRSARAIREQSAS